jgi:hypothetical protein
VENWKVGVGAFRTPTALNEATGWKFVAHNTILEFFLVGGLWGLGVVAVYTWAVVRGLRSVYHHAVARLWQVLLVLMSAVIFWCFSLLSVTYTSILWLLPCMALAGEYWAQSEPKTETRAGTA